MNFFYSYSASICVMCVIFCYIFPNVTGLNMRFHILLSHFLVQNFKLPFFPSIPSYLLVQIIFSEFFSHFRTLNCVPCFFILCQTFFLQFSAFSLKFFLNFFLGRFLLFSSFHMFSSLPSPCSVPSGSDHDFYL